MSPKVAGHGKIKPLPNPDGSVSLICAKEGCDKPVQPWGRGEDGVLIWRHVAPGRKVTGESQWLNPIGAGFADSGYLPERGE
jgi:hypothetical protein